MPIARERDEYETNKKLIERNARQPANETVITAANEWRGIKTRLPFLRQTNTQRQQKEKKLQIKRKHALRCSITHKMCDIKRAYILCRLTFVF